MTAKAKLICPHCGAGPFSIRKAYDAHVDGCAPEVSVAGPGSFPEEEASAPRTRPPTEPQPEPEPEPLVCPDCGQGPYKDRRGLAAHRGSHVDVACPDCGAPCKRSGLGAHRYHAHRIQGARAADKSRRQRQGPTVAGPRPTQRALAAALAHLLPGTPLADTLTAFVAKHRPDPDLWLVATTIPNRGPWLCRVGQLGLLAQREHTPILAVHVADIIALVDHPPAEATA